MNNTSRVGAARRGTLPILEIIGLLMLLISILLFIVQIGLFSQERQNLPRGLSMGGVPVGGMSRAEAEAYIKEVYGSPVSVYYQDREIRLSPDSVGFQVNTETMLARADELRTEGTFWAGFWDFLWARPEQSYEIALDATYSQESLNAWVADLAARYDREPTPAQPDLDTLAFTDGQPGFSLDQRSAIAAIDAVLRKPVDRTIYLFVSEKRSTHSSLETLEASVVQYLVSQEFEGVASVYVLDLESGEELDMNVDFRSGSPAYITCDIAYASTSTMKIPIMVEFFNYLTWEPTPESDDYKNVFETMVVSGNDSANIMLQKIGGGAFADSGFREFRLRGAEIVTSSMQRLGLENTFIVSHYDDDEDPVYYSTPAREAARSGDCVNTRPDPYMQTTTKDLGILLDMIYQCAEFNGGGLLAAYPDGINQQDCQFMVELMSQNFDGVLIRAGLPEGTTLAHKHGWATDTHGDAGIVYSPGGDYVLVVFLWADTTWLEAGISFPLIEGISKTAFNFFNPDMVDAPRLGLGGLTIEQ